MDELLPNVSVSALSCVATQAALMPSSSFE
jgi:hypothetical protein